jgi:hypothetical protein
MSETDSLMMNLKRIPLEINRKRKSRKKFMQTPVQTNEDGKKIAINSKNIENIQQNLENYEKMIKKLKLNAPPSQSLHSLPEERSGVYMHQNSDHMDYYPMMMDGPPAGGRHPPPNYHGPYSYSSYVYPPPPHQMEYRHSHIGNVPPPYIHPSHQPEFGSYHGMSYGMGGNPYMRYDDRTKVESEES